jgi:hypothetical protein
MSPAVTGFHQSAPRAADPGDSIKGSRSLMICLAAFEDLDGY